MSIPPPPSTLPMTQCSPWLSIEVAMLRNLAIYSRLSSICITTVRIKPNELSRIQLTLHATRQKHNDAWRLMIARLARRKPACSVQPFPGMRRQWSPDCSMQDYYERTSSPSPLLSGRATRSHTPCRNDTASIRHEIVLDFSAVVSPTVPHSHVGGGNTLCHAKSGPLFHGVRILEC